MDKHLKHLSYRADIDGLRAIAVISVVIFHAFPSYLKSGYLGVDIFFVISGFLITSIILGNIRRNTFSYLEFYDRRIKRIFPALILVLTSVYLVGYFFLIPNEFINLNKHISGGAGFVSNFVLLGGGDYFSAASEKLPLLHLWSLGIEEQFYIFWPLIVGFLWIRQFKFKPVMIILVIGLTSFVYNIVQSGYDPMTSFYSPLSRFWELLVGATLAAILIDKDTGNYGNNSNLKSIFGLFLIIYSLIQFKPDWLYMGIWLLLPCMGTWLIISAGKNSWLNKIVLSNKVIVFIGLISYPLYLWHWPILSFIRILYPEPSWQIRILGIFIAVILSLLTYVYLERYIKQTTNKKMGIVLLVLMVFVLVGSFLSYRDITLVKNITSTQFSLSKEYNTKDIYRYRKCFLDTTEQGVNDFPSICNGDVSNGIINRKSVLIWGDSHAAHLFPGLKMLGESSGFQLAQRTATSCAPFLPEKNDSSRCARLNLSTKEFVIKEQPSIVVLGSSWVRDSDNLEKKLQLIISFLKKTGVEKIIVVGSPPIWRPSLIEVLLRRYKVVNVVPVTLVPPKDGFIESVEIDRKLSEITTNLDVGFISVIDSFCVEQNCLVRLGENYPDDLITPDYGHLTKKSSEFLFGSDLVKSFFRNTPK